MTRSLAIVRVFVYALFASGAAISPDIARTFGMLAPTKPAASSPALVDAASATLGWLAQAFASALAGTLGFAGLGFATGCAVLATLALVEWRARRVSSPATALLAVVLCGVCLLDASHVGGGATNAFFFAALLVALDLSGTFGVIAIAVVAVLWCNSSPVGIFAPIFAIAYALGAIVDRAQRPERLRTQIGALVAAVATLATPALASFPLDSWRAIALDNGVTDLLVTTPPVAAPIAYSAGVIVTIVAALAFGTRSTRTGATFVFLMAAYFAFSQGAFVPFLGIAGGPILAESIGRLYARARVASFDGPAFARTLAFTAIPLALLVGVLAVGGLPALSDAEASAPFGTLAKLSREPAKRGRLLCTKLAWCDVAERRYGIDVVADTRLASASDATIQMQRTLSGAKKGWIAKARSARVDAVFLDARSGLVTVLLADGWRKFATDGTGTLFVREPATL